MTNIIDDKIIALLLGGAVGFMPTDTIYGLSCVALDEAAVNRIRNIKKRSEHKRMIVLISGLDQLSDLGIDKQQAKIIIKYWPGALTAVFRAENSPYWLSRGQGEFGIRMPDNQQLLGLIRTVGPLISTSANFEGEDPINNPEHAQKSFGSLLDFYVDVGVIDGTASTVVDIKNGLIEILRSGPVKINP